MRENTHKKSFGFSYIELIICSVVLVIIALSVGPILTGGQSGWKKTNAKATSDTIRDSFVARITFQKTVRRASRQSVRVSNQSDWIELSYYDRPDSTELDRYAMLYYSDGCLRLEQGQIDSEGAREVSIDTVVCENVSACVFTQNGRSAAMNLTLDEGADKITVAVAAIMNND